MRRQRIIALLFIFGIIIVFLGVMFILQKTFQDEELIGGQRDESGCLIGAGYSFSNEIRACIREWEIDTESKRRAAKIAVDFVGREDTLTIVEVSSLNCYGCFVVSLEKGEENRESKKIFIDDWRLIEQNLGSKECESLGGKTIDISISYGCAKNERNIGIINKPDSTSICCIKSE